MDLQSFRNSFVKIEPIGDAGVFGHHPFQLIAVTSDGGNEINAIFAHGMDQIIRRVREYVLNGAREVFLSLDLPAGQGIKNDFIFLIHLVGNKKEGTMIIEYSTEDGSIISESSGEAYPLICEMVRYFVSVGLNPCI